MDIVSFIRHKIGHGVRMGKQQSRSLQIYLNCEAEGMVDYHSVCNFLKFVNNSDLHFLLYAKNPKLQKWSMLYFFLVARMYVLICMSKWSEK